VYSISGQWKWLISPNVYSRLAYLGEGVNLGFGMSRIKMDIDALVHGMREDVTHKMDRHELKYGAELHQGRIDQISYLPLDLSDQSTWTDSTLEVWRSEVHYQGWKGGAYVQDTWQMMIPFYLTGGLRYDFDWVIASSRVSPRFSLKYEVTPLTHIRGAWGHYYQVPAEATEIEGGESLDHEKAIHYVLGVEREFRSDVRGWVEVYRKDYTSLLTVDSLRQFSNDGSGFAQGVEVFLQKEGNPSAWASYSLSEAKRREYLDGEESYFDYDQRYLLSLVSSYSHGRWDFQMKWRYASGKPYTPIVEAVPDSAGWIPIDGERNSARNPAYHRLDLKVDTGFHIGHLKCGAYVEFLNLYNRQNVMGYTYSEDYSTKEPYYGLPLIPSVGLSVEF
jgi:outer membrane receptor protein involved in Fe transport